MTLTGLVNKQKIVSEIKSGNRILLKKLYDGHRKEFIQWVKKQYGIDEEHGKEIYQKAFTALYYNVREGKLETLTSSLKTYLFSIGRNQLKDHLKEEKKFAGTLDHQSDAQAIDYGIMKKYEENDLKEIVRKLLERIGEPCKTVLELYYFKHYSMESIARHMNYKSEQIAAKRKFICLKQMRSLMQSRN